MNGNGATSGTLQTVTTGAAGEQTCPFGTVTLTFTSGYANEDPPDDLLLSLGFTFEEP